jgi:parvulin-like peptidyl-prolyl isomerase
MAAQPHRLLTAAAALLLSACAGNQPAAATRQTVEAVAPLPEVTLVPPRVPAQDGDFPSTILLPDPSTGDEEVARVGSLVLRRSHAFVRLLAADPKVALSAVDLLVFDVLVQRHAEQFGIRVRPERVRELASAEAAQMGKQVQAEFGGKLSLADYVWRIFGMTLADWQKTTELRVAQRLYQGYVIRYLALREEQVQVRYIVHADGKLLAELRGKVLDGADFATLAQRHSQDALRRDGGLLPPFGPGFPHPVSKVAFTLQPGGVAEPFVGDLGGEPKHFLVYCLSRRPGRDVPFAAVRDEIDADLQRRTLEPLEINAYTLRWRPTSEARPAATTDR